MYSVGMIFSKGEKGCNGGGGGREEKGVKY